MGCILSLIGLLCFALCLWIFSGYIAQKVASLTGDSRTPEQLKIAHSTGIQLNKRKVITGLKVNRGEFCQLAVGFLFKKDNLEELVLDFEYQVLNQKGQKIFIDQGRFTSKNSKVPVKEQWLNEQKALEYYLESFPLPDSRTINIRFTLTGTSEQLDKIQLRVYSLEKSSTHMSLTTGILLLALSCALAVVGLFLFIVGKTEEMEEVLS